MIESVQPIHLITPVIKDEDLSTKLFVFQFKYINWVKAGPFLSYMLNLAKSPLIIKLH